MVSAYNRWTDSTRPLNVFWMKESELEYHGCLTLITVHFLESIFLGHIVSWWLKKIGIFLSRKKEWLSGSPQQHMPQYVFLLKAENESNHYFLMVTLKINVLEFKQIVLARGYLISLGISSFRIFSLWPKPVLIRYLSCVLPTPFTFL